MDSHKRICFSAKWELCSQPRTIHPDLHHHRSTSASFSSQVTEGSHGVTVMEESNNSVVNSAACMQHDLSAVFSDGLEGGSHRPARVSQQSSDPLSDLMLVQWASSYRTTSCSQSVKPLLLLTGPQAPLTCIQSITSGTLCISACDSTKQCHRSPAMPWSESAMNSPGHKKLF